MTEFDRAPTEPDRPPSDPSVDDLPGEPDEVDMERGSADGSSRHNEVLNDSLARAGVDPGVGERGDSTTDDEDPSVG
jgi:hypothetical protein